MDGGIFGIGGTAFRDLCIFNFRNNYKINECIKDLHNSDLMNDILQIKTTYEEIFSKQGAKIYYLNFTL